LNRSPTIYIFFYPPSFHPYCLSLANCGKIFEKEKLFPPLRGPWSSSSPSLSSLPLIFTISQLGKGGKKLSMSFYGFPLDESRKRSIKTRRWREKP